MRWEVCAEAETGDEAVLLAKHFRPDMVILDLNMPGITGLQATVEIKQAVSGIEMVILTCHYSAPLLQAIAQAGGLGFHFEIGCEPRSYSRGGSSWAGRTIHQQAHGRRFPRQFKYDSTARVARR
jgi:CheY-like chemotaxis protein